MSRLVSSMKSVGFSRYRQPIYDYNGQEHIRKHRLCIIDSVCFVVYNTNRKQEDILLSSNAKEPAINEGAVRSMILYHGSNIEVREPKLLKIQRDLDVGRGFYTTTDLQQATTWASRTARIRRTGTACVSVYEMDDKALNTLRVLRFEKPNQAWLAYVAANRRGQAVQNDWDVVFGPVANDQTMQTLLLYLDRFLTAEQTIASLLPQKLKDQLTFKTEKAISSLRFTEVIHVE